MFTIEENRVSYDDDGNNDNDNPHVRPTGSNRIGRINGPAGIPEDGARGKDHGRQPNKGRCHAKDGLHGDVHGTTGQKGIACNW